MGLSKGSNICILKAKMAILSIIFIIKLSLRMHYTNVYAAFDFFLTRLLASQYCSINSSWDVIVSAQEQCTSSIVFWNYYFPGQE